jgi:hypothetical protein
LACSGIGRVYARWDRGKRGDYVIRREIALMSKSWNCHCVGSLAFICIVEFVPLSKLTLTYIGLLAWLTINKVSSVLK